MLILFSVFHSIFPSLVGFFQAGLLHGLGTKTYANGDTLNCVFANDEACGHGTFKAVEGRYYVWVFIVCGVFNACMYLICIL